MSTQTKEQAIGYLMQAALKSSLPAKYLVDLAITANKLLDNDAVMDNYETLKALKIIVDKNEWSLELEKEITSQLHYAYDVKTIDEAEDIFYAFKDLFPVLRR